VNRERRKWRDREKERSGERDQERKKETERARERERERERESDALREGQKRDQGKRKNREGELRERTREKTLRNRELEDDWRPDSSWVFGGTTPTEPGANFGGTRADFQRIRAGFPTIFSKISGGFKNNFRWGILMISVISEGFSIGNFNKLI